MDKHLEIAARTAGMAVRDIAAKLDSLRTGITYDVAERMDDHFGHMEKKLSGIGSGVGSLASAYRTSKATPTRRIDPATVVARACLIRLWAHEYGKSPDTLANEVYGAAAGAEVVRALNEPGAWLVERAATSPAMTMVAGWAADLVGASTNHGVIRTIAPTAVYSQLTAHGARLRFSGNAAVKLVNRATAPTGQFFRNEGSPIPVRAESFSSTNARTFSGGIATLLSGELLRRSSPSAETVLKEALQQDAQLEIDSVLLSNAAATATSPAGILNGATVVTPTSITGNDPQSAAIKDISNLIGAIPSIADPVFIGQLAVTARLIGFLPALLSNASRLTVIAAPFLPASTLVLLDGSDFWSAENDDFVIDSTFEASIVSAAPALPIVDAAGVAGQPVYSAFQMDLACIRLLVDLGWGMRSAGRVASVGPVAW